MEQALKECAEWARSEVLLRRMEGRSPTPEECREAVGTNSRGEVVTRAMQLGEEMHQHASECAGRRLEEVLPGRFSLEQRFRYNPQTRGATPISSDEVAALLKRGAGHELLGTIKPDVVLHLGNPVHAQAIYDFKFPCVNMEDGEVARWRRYPRGHPYERRTQKEVYEQLLGVASAQIRRVIPRWGVLP
ncbi:hypothetical protein P2318_01385 [Myxococcaceae bacterium GXIMD 01537]